MPTLLEKPGALDSAALCAALSLSFVELNMNLPGYQPERMDERSLFEARERYGVAFTLHLDENLNVCDINPLVSKAYTQTALWAIDLAKRHGMPVLNMHLPNGVYFTLPGRKVYLYEAYPKDYLSVLRDFRSACEDAIGGAAIRVYVENCGGFPSFAREGIELLLESEAFGLTWDIGHNHCAGGVDEPFLRLHLDKLRHMHLHDAKGAAEGAAEGAACHLPFGAGVLDIPAFLALAKSRACRCVLEVKTIEGLKQSKEWLDGF